MLVLNIISKAFNEYMLYMLILVNSAVGTPVYVLHIQITSNQYVTWFVSIHGLSSPMFALIYIFSSLPACFIYTCESFCKVYHTKLVHF